MTEHLTEKDWEELKWKIRELPTERLQEIKAISDKANSLFVGSAEGMAASQEVSKVIREILEG